ncbi:MAG: hypothetical protein K0S47_1845 [Herbinix sp.]|jgi:serine protease Do|nr:hypothetical protein [Herbinix sp.]
MNNENNIENNNEFQQNPNDLNKNHNTESNQTDQNGYAGYQPYSNTQNMSYQYSSTQDQYSNPYITPDVSGDKKKNKKKRNFSGIMMLTAGAVAFGIVAGAAFQGYSYISDIQKDKTVKEETVDNDIKDITNGLVSNDEEDTEAVTVDTVSDGVVTDVSGVVEQVMPSIVAINSSGTVTNYDFFGNGFSQPMEGSGSGIIIGQNGSELLIVTNNHVIAGASEVEIVFIDEKTTKATVKGADANADLAILSVDMTTLTEETTKAIKIATLGDSNDLKAGELAIAIGNALGYGQSVTVGYISALDREVTVDNVTRTLLQTDAAINPGNSGGALLNIKGEVIGINSVKFASEEVEGMGYSIPISDAIPLINELMNRKTLDKTEQGFLGINIETAQVVDDIYADRFKMPKGIYINEVVAGSPADKAGLVQGNIIAGLDDKTIETVDDLLNILSYTQAGKEISLKVYVIENGSYVEKDLKITLANRPQD